MSFCFTRTTRVTGSPSERLEVFGELVRDLVVDPTVRETAARIRRQSGRDGELAAALAHVQSFPTRPDPPGGGNTVCDARSTELLGGRCVVRSIYLAGLYGVWGYPVELVWLPQPRWPLDHVTVRVLCQGAWWWADPTIPGARLGEHPWDAARGMVQ